MPYAIGLDAVGTDKPFTIDGVTVGGEYLEISWDDYLAAIDCLTSGQHICVVDGELVLDFTLDSGIENTP